MLPVDYFLGIMLGCLNVRGYKPHDNSTVITNQNGEYIREMDADRNHMRFRWGVRREGGALVRFMALVQSEEGTPEITEVVHHPNVRSESWEYRVNGEVQRTTAEHNEAFRWVDELVAMSVIAPPIASPDVPLAHH